MNSYFWGKLTLTKYVRIAPKPSTIAGNKIATRGEGPSSAPIKRGTKKKKEEASTVTTNHHLKISTKMRTRVSGSGGEPFSGQFSGTTLQIRSATWESIFNLPLSRPKVNSAHGH